MRKWICVPMMTFFLLTACGGSEEMDVRAAYREMTGCTMEAVVSCQQGESIWEAELRCDYVPEGESTVEVLAPETIQGVRAKLDLETWILEYEDACLNAGPVGPRELSPAACLPRLMSALRDGWLLEENKENWGETPCHRLTVDQTGSDGGKILSTLWLREEDGYPVRGEIAVDGEIILTAEFTEFSFHDIIQK